MIYQCYCTAKIRPCTPSKCVENVNFAQKIAEKDGLQKNIPPIPRKILDLRHKDEEESDAVSSASANFPKCASNEHPSPVVGWVKRKETPLQKHNLSSMESKRRQQSMNKKNLTRVAGLSAAAMLALSGMAMAETTESALVKGGALNLRETASLDAKVLGQYPTGTLVEIIKAGSEWHRVSVNGKTGYMLAKYLNSADSAISATVRTNTGTGLNLREQPNMNGTIIMAIKNGQSVSVLQKSSPWSRVKVGNREGYVATKYLNFGSSSGSVSGTAAVVHNPKSTQVLNLRREPNLDAQVLAYYHNGTKVTILGNVDSKWVKVQVQDGKIGYMMKQYLKVSGGAGEVKPFTAKLWNVNGGSYVNFRKGASLNAEVLARVPVGTEVKVLEHGTDWCKVEVDGKTGYISTWFMKW